MRRLRELRRLLSISRAARLRQTQTRDVFTWRWSSPCAASLPSSINERRSVQDVRCATNDPRPKPREILDPEKVAEAVDDAADGDYFVELRLGDRFAHQLVAGGRGGAAT